MSSTIFEFRKDSAIRIAELSELIVVIRKISNNEPPTELDKSILLRHVEALETLSNHALISHAISAIRSNPFILISKLEELLAMLPSSTTVSTSSLPPPPDRSSSPENAHHSVVDLVAEIARLRTNRFHADMTGRSIEIRTAIVREYITALNNLHHYDSSVRIHLTNIDITRVDFCDINLQQVEFGRNSVEGCHFLRCQLAVEQLVDVINFQDTTFDPDFYEQLVHHRNQQYLDAIEIIQENIKEAHAFYQCLPKFYSLANVTANFDVEVSLGDITDQELHCMTFMLMNDHSINLIPEHDYLSYLWCSEHRQDIMAMNRPELLQALTTMITARNYYLPFEVLSLAIDHKLYMIQMDLDRLKMQLEYYTVTLPSFPSDLQQDLRQQSMQLTADIKRLKVESEQSRSSNNILRIQLYLSHLNDPHDTELEYGPTERLEECIKLAEIENVILDLTGKDLSQVNFQKISFRNIQVAINKEHEVQYLPEKLIDQRYSRLYEYAKNGQQEALDRYITQCDLDVNLQERGSHRTAVMYACSCRHFALAKHLVETYNARLDLVTVHNWSIVDALASIAIYKGNEQTEDMDFLRYLLSKNIKLTIFQAAEMGALGLLEKFNVKDLLLECPARKKTVLHIAAEKGYPHILQYLAKKMIPFDKEYPHLPNVLYIAADGGHLQAVKTICSICPKLVNRPFRDELPVKVALKQKYYEIVRYLNEQAPNSKDVEVWVALADLSWIQDYLSSLAKLPKTKAAQYMNGLDELMYHACIHGHNSIVKEVLKHPIDLNYRYEAQFQRRAIDMACYVGSTSLMNILLEHQDKIDLNASSKQCPPLLFVALMRKHFDIVSELLNRKVEVKVTYLGKNPLQHLLSLDRIDENLRFELAERLIKMGCSLLDIDSEGDTVMHYAARVGEEMLTLVTKNLLSLKNKNGKAPNDLVVRTNQST